MVVSLAVICLLFPEHLESIIQLMLKFHLHRSTVTNNYGQDIMLMSKHVVKHSTYVPSTKHLASYVPMAQSSVKNGLFVCGGINSTAAQLLVYMEIINLSMIIPRMANPPIALE